MTLIADILLAAAALGAMFYCLVLSRRLRRFNDLETGVGGAIATLSTQVEDMTKTLRSTQDSAAVSSQSLGDITQRAEAAAGRLELLVAALHDLPAAPEDGTPATVPKPAEPPVQARDGGALFLSNRRDPEVS